MQDPLSINVPLQGVETTLPLLNEGDYLVQVAESSADPNKDGTGLNWNLKLALVDPTIAVDGRTVNPNFPLFAVYALQARDDSKDKEAFMRSLGETMDALFDTDKSTRPALTAATIQDAVGKKAVATVYLDEYPKGSGNKNNKVRRLKKVA